MPRDDVQLQFLLGSSVRRNKDRERASCRRQQQDSHQRLATLPPSRSKQHHGSTTHGLQNEPFRHAYASHSLGLSSQQNHPFGMVHPLNNRAPFGIPTCFFLAAVFIAFTMDQSQMQGGDEMHVQGLCYYHDGIYWC